MTRTALSALAVFTLLLQAAVVRAQAAKDIVTKAIEAHGGEANLKDSAMSRITMKGVLIVVPGAELPIDGESTYQLPDRFRNVINFDSNGKKTAFVQIYNAGKAKFMENNQPKKVDDIHRKQMKGALYLQELCTLVPLVDEQKFEIRSLDKADNVGDKEVVGIVVKSKGMNEVRMFFEKSTHLLLKMEHTGLTLDGKEVPQTDRFLEYKKFDGVLRPTKAELYMDGKKFMTSESISYKNLDKIDPKEFDVSD